MTFTPNINGDILAVILFTASPYILFFGEKLFIPALCLLSFATAALGTYWILMAATSFSGLTMLIIMLVVGLLAAILAVKIFKFGVFVAGAAAGVLICNAVYQLIASSTHQNSPAFRYALVAGFALCGGLVTLFLLKYILRVVLSFVGGYMVVAPIDHAGVRFGWWTHASLDASSAFFSQPDQFTCTSGSCYGLFIGWIILAFLGVLVQFKLYQRRKRTAPHSEAHHLPLSSSSPNINSMPSRLSVDSRNLVVVDGHPYYRMEPIIHNK